MPYIYIFLTDKNVKHFQQNAGISNGIRKWNLEKKTHIQNLSLILYIINKI